ncbi:copper homeostasis membrane protein CopD [Salmonella enterica]
MLVASYVGLRFIHFAALMLIFGSVLFSALLAPRKLRHRLLCHFHWLIRLSLWLNAGSATLMFALQGGMMGNGWQDVWQPDTWLAVTGTYTGAVMLWQIALAVLALLIALVQPQRQSPLLLLIVAQLLLAANLGHAAMHEGTLSVIQRGNHALHLLCAAMWLGGLPPLLFCMRLAQGRNRAAAILAMMRFSRYGHFAVAGVIFTGIVNTLLIQGSALPWQSSWGRLLLLKCALVALMVVIALVNRYVLVPRMNQQNGSAQQHFMMLTWVETGLGALVLAAVSLFATWEPF